jgi:hypothetical protein
MYPFLSVPETTVDTATLYDMPSTVPGFELTGPPPPGWVQCTLF